MTAMRGREFYEKLGSEGNEYGETLKQNVRWSHFKPEWLANKDWVHILGDDADNFLHMGYMAELTEQYIDRTRGWGYELSDEDAQTLRDTAYIHDFPEAIDGDVPDTDKKFDKKTFEQEKRSMLKVLGSVAVAKEAQLISSRVIPVMQGRSLLSHHWRAIEVIGYTETTKRAGYKFQDLDELREELRLSHEQTEELGEALQLMATKVHAQNLDKLRQFSFLPAVKEYLLDCDG